MIDLQKFSVIINSLTNAKNIAVALSGGADSMCLCYLLNEWSKINNKSFIALIVNHNIRIESTDEAHWVSDYLENYNITCKVLSWDSKITNNIHQNARVARYKLMTEYCKDNNYQVLATAHNQNDQAETVLMRILRGSGIDGITAIPLKRLHNGIDLIRPLLDYTREEIEATLNSVGWKWINDPSNFNTKYTRTQIRNFLNQMPNPNMAVKRFALLAKNAQRTKKFIDKYIDDLIQKICKESVYGYIEIDFESFIKCEEEIMLRIINHYLKIVSGNHYVPRLKSLDLLLSQLHSYEKSSAPELIKTIHGCEIIIKDKNMFVIRELDAVECLKNINDIAVWDNRYEVQTTMKNYSVGPLGKNGLKQLKKIVKYLPAARLLYATPAIFEEDRLVAYPLNNHLLNEEMKFKKIK